MHRLFDHLTQWFRNALLRFQKIMQRLRLLIDVLVKDDVVIRTSKRLFACKHLIKHDTQSIHVRARVRCPFEYLLWRHIRRTSNQLLFLCDIFLALGKFRKTKIKNLDIILLAFKLTQNNICRLDIAVNQTQLVRFPDTTKRLNGNRNKRVAIKWPRTL